MKRALRSSVTIISSRGTQWFTLGKSRTPVKFAGEDLLKWIQYEGIREECIKLSQRFEVLYDHSGKDNK